MEHLPRLTIFWARNKFQQIGRVQVCSLTCVNPQVNDSLERLAEFRKAVLLMVSVDYNKRLQITMCKGKNARVESRRDQTQAFSGLPRMDMDST